MTFTMALIIHYLPLIICFHTALSQRSHYAQNSYEDSRRNLDQLGQPPTYQQRNYQDTRRKDNYGSYNGQDTFGADAGCRDPWSTEWTRDPNDCAQVHFCVQGKKYWTINCNDTRVWSNVGHACVEPMSQWDDCNQIMTTPRLNDPRCLGEPNGMNPDPDNCAQFLACVNMTVVATMDCPTNTLFSTRNSTCELSFLVAAECRDRSIPGHVKITTANPIVDKPCEGTSNGDVSDPIHCGRFYKCNYGRVVARITCPSNSAFNDVRRKCDWRANVDCGERPS